MIIEEENINKNYVYPVLSLSKGKTVNEIFNCIKLSVTPFLQAYNLSKSDSTFNEDDLTQILYSQVQSVIRKQNHPFNVGNQERDLTKLSKGIPDLFFYADRLGKPPFSIFSIECKRLPTPTKSREKEYVIGDKNNGGIERFKTKKHGKGLNECGLLGFVEKENFNYWNKTINNWINDLTTTNKDWKKDEVLLEIESDTDYCVLKSIAHRESDDINLTHLWISIV
jgi:hypothetical protein